MALHLSDLKLELRPMLRLALPVVAAELGWVSLGIVDLLMVGRLGAESIGAVSVGRSVYFFIIIFGMGLLLGLDTVVSNAFGAGEPERCHRALIHGGYMTLAMTLPFILALRLAAGELHRVGLNPSVSPLARSYLLTLSWTVLPMLMFFTCRRYLQAVHVVRPVMMALISSNLVNVVANWILIFGNLGAPRLGVTGAGWATVISMAYMTLFLVATIWLHERETGLRLLNVSRRIDWSLLRELLGLGLPAGFQLLLEMGVFSLATLIVGGLDAASLAAHQVAITLASTTYMITLGISSAAAVRVGHARGRQDAAGASRAGWTALALGGGFMLLACAVFFAIPRFLIRIFTDDPAVMQVGILLVYTAAVFQFFDGVQVIATGALRGGGDTRTPLIWNLVGYWVFGLPVGYVLCFRHEWGALGIWFGLSTGLIIVGVVLLIAWSRRTRRWLSEPQPAS